LAGYREVPNQKRTQLANSLASAERSLASTSQTRNQLRGLDYSEMSRGSQNLAMFTNLVNEFTSSAAESDVASLRAQLSAEPMIVSEPVYRSYAYSVDARRVSKQTVVQWTLLDLKTGRSLAGQETLAEAKDFKVVAGVDANDENAGRILAGYSSVEDIQGFANQPVRIPLAEVWLKIRGDLASRW
jgi:hypothetical protein